VLVLCVCTHVYEKNENALLFSLECLTRGLTVVLGGGLQLSSAGTAYNQEHLNLYANDAFCVIGNVGGKAEICCHEVRKYAATRSVLRPADA